MFIYQLAKELSALAGLDYYSANKGNLSDTDPDISNNRNCCYAPLRVMPPSMDPSILGDYNIILHLRDPRDLLVSFYFAQAYSHPGIQGGFNPSDQERKQWREWGIDRFILREKKGKDKTLAEKFVWKYEIYLRYLLNKSNVVFAKYEEMVTDFRSWLSKIIPPFSIPDSEKVITRLARKHRDSFKITRENIWDHKRKITPGDYKEKLKPETIRELNILFKDILRKLDYET